jgi:hypothetical protein
MRRVAQAGRDRRGLCHAIIQRPVQLLFKFHSYGNQLRCRRLDPVPMVKYRSVVPTKPAGQSSAQVNHRHMKVCADGNRRHSFGHRHSLSAVTAS